jgi:hypothetical protein
MKRITLLGCLLLTHALGQEANSGVDLRVTLSAGAATSNSEGTAAGFRSMLYPTWKVNEHWSVSGALQIDSRHYFLENLSGSGDGVKGYLLQGRLNYSLVRGALPSHFPCVASTSAPARPSSDTSE